MCSNQYIYPLDKVIRSLSNWGLVDRASLCLHLFLSFRVENWDEWEGNYAENGEDEEQGGTWQGKLECFF